MAKDNGTPWTDAQTRELVEQALTAVHAGLSIDAEEKIGELFSIAQEWVEKSPPPGWHFIEEAVECELQCDWPGAERAYLERLRLEEEQLQITYGAHRDLAALYRLLGRPTAEFEHLKRATNSARASGSQMLLLVALRGEAHSQLRLGRIDDAEATAFEAFGVLGLEDEAYSTQLRASHLVLRARCACAGNRLTEADDDLRFAMELLEPMSCVDVAGGVQDDLRDWWAATAEVRAAKFDLIGSREARESAVAQARHVDSLEQCAGVYTRFSLTNALERLAEACVQCGDSASATASIEEATTIRRALKLPEAKT